MDTKPLLSINIPTYNRIAYLKVALAALLPQLSDEVEINVTDNHSTDGTWEFLESLNGKVKRHRPPAPIDANYNILSCLNLGSGAYTWIHCDDDIARLNAARNITQAIKDFDYPPALSIEWDGEGLDPAMSGFVNREAAARWKRCDRNEFLRLVSFKFTFASAIIIRRGCADEEYIRTHAPTPLIPGNIVFSTVGRYNDAVVSLDPLLAARISLGNGDLLSVFSKQVVELFEMNKGLGYSPAVLRKTYSDSLRTVVVHAAVHFPITRQGLWNVARCSWRYKNFYRYVVPALFHRCAPRLSKGMSTTWHGIAQIWRVPRRLIGSLTRSFLN